MQDLAAAKGDRSPTRVAAVRAAAVNGLTPPSADRMILLEVDVAVPLARWLWVRRPHQPRSREDVEDLRQPHAPSAAVAAGVIPPLFAEGAGRLPGACGTCLAPFFQEGAELGEAPMAPSPRRSLPIIDIVERTVRKLPTTVVSAFGGAAGRPR